MIEEIIDPTETFTSELLESIFSWIKSLFIFILDNFLDFFHGSSDIGKHTFSVFEGFFAGGFSLNTVYLFFGVLVIVFIFRLIWDLIP